MSDRKAEDFPLEKPSLGDSPKTDKESEGYKLMMKSYESSMKEWNYKSSKKEENVPLLFRALAKKTMPGFEQMRRFFR